MAGNQVKGDPVEGSPLEAGLRRRLGVNRIQEKGYNDQKKPGA